MKISIISLIYFIAFSHAIMIAIVLWRRSAPRDSGRILSVLMMTIAYKLFEGGVIYSDIYKVIPHSLDLLPGAVLVMGPIFYGYVKSVSGEKKFSAAEWGLHLIPAIALILYNSPAVLISTEAKIAMWSQISNSTEIKNIPLNIILLLTAIKIHLAVYLTLSWRNLTQFSETVHTLRSDDSDVILSRLKFLAIALFSLEILWVTLFLVQQYTGIMTVNYVSQIWLLVIAFVVLSMGYYGLKKPNFLFTPEERSLILVSKNSPKITEDTPSNDKIKYFQSALPESAGHEIAILIETALEKEQLYLDDKLTLTELSNKLSLKSHMVSQVINQFMNSNFYKLINDYRVQHAEALITDPNNIWSLERIAFESGFGNRVTFTKAFKEQLGCSPSAYKKQQKKAV